VNAIAITAMAGVEIPCLMAFPLMTILLSVSSHE